jgi:hypothetical protein
MSDDGPSPAGAAPPVSAAAGGGGAAQNGNDAGLHNGVGQSKGEKTTFTKSHLDAQVSDLATSLSRPPSSNSIDLEDYFVSSSSLHRVSVTALDIPIC